MEPRAGEGRLAWLALRASCTEAWIKELQNGDFADMLSSLPSNTTGQMLVRFTEARCVQLCGGNARRGHTFFKLLHNVMQRVDASRRQCVKGHSMLRSTSADRYSGLAAKKKLKACSKSAPNLMRVLKSSSQRWLLQAVAADEWDRCRKL